MTVNPDSRSLKPPFSYRPVESQVALAMEWIAKYATPLKSVNRKAHSYSLKHMVERWSGQYVSNESFIEAARRSGYKEKEIYHPFICDPTNYLFAMSIMKAKKDPESGYDPSFRRITQTAPPLSREGQ